ncbi:hypothetical protein [Hyalangium rubrum]|uniref:Cep192/Spd-2-like domain-containing protein n=1 Tax=Hyalangium rubrum TaxID=3103134 RepID=A0ABU5GZG5_9BACT|nr:hypothetical protein [Hyalangium sp. s54d21]MDY7226530.1 hypothetical protein [Hyalangium sp. s54d21]
MRLRTLLLPIILLALAGCGEDEEALKEGPFLFLDRESLGFDVEFGSGTYVGATGFNTLYIENRGDQPLEIKQVTKSGDGVFTLRLPQELSEGKSLVLESRKITFVEVQFKPTQAKDYTGTFTIESNAGNGATKAIPLTGRGIPPP